MSTYVDDLRDWPKYVLKARGRKASEKRWCHLTTDGDIEELHAFARSIGVDGTRFVEGSAFMHYDLNPLKRAQAVQAGSIEVTERVMREVMQYSKE